MNAFHQLDKLFPPGGTSATGAGTARRPVNSPRRRHRSEPRAAVPRAGSSTPAADFVQHLQRTVAALRSAGEPATPQKIYARLLPAWQDWWDACPLPDTWLAQKLWMLRRRLEAWLRESGKEHKTPHA